MLTATAPTNFVPSTTKPEMLIFNEHGPFRRPRVLLKTKNLGKAQMAAMLPSKSLGPRKVAVVIDIEQCSGESWFVVYEQHGTVVRILPTAEEAAEYVVQLNALEPGLYAIERRTLFLAPAVPEIEDIDD